MSHYLERVPALLELACYLVTKFTASASEPGALSRKFVTFKVSQKQLLAREGAEVRAGGGEGESRLQVLWG